LFSDLVYVMFNEIVYCGMCADVLHVGHINLLREAAGLGCRVVVGLLTDEAIASYKPPPLMPFEHRRVLVESLRMVDEVVAQRSLDYEENLLRYLPKYVFTGTTGVLGFRRALGRGLWACWRRTEGLLWRFLTRRVCLAVF